MIENTENHIAYTCKCGGVNFAMLKSGGIECNKCSTTLDGVKWWSGGMGAQIARAIKAEDALLALQVTQQAVPAWLPASNPPTEAQGEVLVLMRDGTCEIAWTTYWHGSSNAFAGWMFRDPDMEDATPTHWMPLPTPPAAPKGAV